MNFELSDRVDEYVKSRHYRLLNSILLYKDDELLIERYYNHCNETSRHNIKSIWKSILSVCCGIAIDNGFIKSVDEPVSAYLPMFDGRNHPYHQMMTVKHLLTMRSGIAWNGGAKYHCPMLTQFNRTKDHLAFLADIKMDTLPGSTHVYKEWDVILLSAVLAAATGMNPFDFCNQYLYGPLEIESGKWFTFSDGLCFTIGTTAAEQKTSDLSARDLLKLGLLFKNSGRWNGKQIVSEAYIREAITPHTPGYGYMWWVYPDGYGCMGYGGQRIRVIPEHDIVYVIQATALNSDREYGDVIDMALNFLP